MIRQEDELISIISKFADSGWDVIDAPSKAWLNTAYEENLSESITAQLIAAVEVADTECGSCGCEFDPLYKRALLLLSTQ